MNRNSNRLLSPCLATLTGIAAAASAAHAQVATYTWTGALNNTWDTTIANWSGDGTTWVNGPNVAIIPDAGSDINLGADITTYIVRFKANRTIDSAGPTLSILAPADGVNQGAYVAAGVTARINAVISSVDGGVNPGFYKTGPGTLTLGGTGPNPYSVPAAIVGGTLIAAASSPLGTGTVSIQSATTLGLEGPGPPMTLANDIEVRGGGAAGFNGAIDNRFGNNFLTGDITLLAPSTIGASGGGLTLSGTLDKAGFPVTFSTFGIIVVEDIIGTGVIEKTGFGFLHLDGATKHSGGLTIQQGVVAIENPQALSSDNVVTMPPGLVSVLRLEGRSLTIGGLAGGDANTFVDNFGSAVPVVLTLEVAAATVKNFAGVISDGGAPLSLLKTGAGTQALTRSSTYSGATVVADGVLRVDGDLPNSPVFITGGSLGGDGRLGQAVTLDSGFLGVLGGELTIEELLTVNGGVVQTGVFGVGSPALALNNGLTATGGNFIIRVPTPFKPPDVYDQIQVLGGNVSLGDGVATLNVENYGGPAYGPEHIVPLITNIGSGSTTGHFADLPNGAEVPSLAGYGGQPHWYIYYNADLSAGLLYGGNDVVVTPNRTLIITRNGSFETGPGSPGNLPVGSTAIQNWTVINANVDWATTTEWQAADGERSVDLQGVNSSGGVQQQVSTFPGHPYRLTFALAGNPNGDPVLKHMRAAADGTTADFEFDTTGATPADMRWVDVWFTFIAEDETTAIELFSYDPPGSFGAVVDDVRVEEAPGDCNADGGVDQIDYSAFHNCMSGPGVPSVDPACGCFDLDHENDVDLRDFARFQIRYGEPLP